MAGTLHAARHLEFIPLVWSTYSSFGPAKSLQWLRLSFRTFTSTLIASGRSATTVNATYRHFWEHLQATMARQNAEAIRSLLITPYQNQPTAAPQPPPQD